MALKLAVKMTADSRDLEKGVERSEKSIRELRDATVEATKTNKLLQDQVTRMGSTGIRSINMVKQGLNNFTKEQRVGTQAVVQQTQMLKQAFEQSGQTGIRVYKGITREVRSLKAEIVALGAAQKTQGQQTQKSGSGLMTIIGRLGGAAALLGGGAVFISFSDQMTNMTNQLRLAVGAEGDLVGTRRALLEISNESRVGVVATTELYSKLSRATKDLNLSQGDLLQITDTINKTFVISGASTAETEGSIRQLSQALNSGVLRGEEFNSVAEQSPRLMQALQDSTGKTAGELRALAADGKLTSQVLIAALTGQAAAISKEFETTESTVAQATTVAMNSIKTLVGVFNEGSGATASLAGGILNVAASFNDFAASMESGQLDAYITSYTDAFHLGLPGIREFFTSSTEEAKTGFGSIRDFINVSIDDFREWMKYAPVTILAGIKKMGVHLRSLVDYVPAYVTKFKDLFLLELEKLAERAGLVSQKILNLFQVFEDPFDLGAALAKSDAYFEGQEANLDALSNTRIAAAKASADAELAAIDLLTQAGKNRIDAGAAQADALLAKYKKSVEEMRGDVGGPREQVDLDAEAPKAISANQLDDLRSALLNEEQLRSEYLQRRVDMVNQAVAAEQIGEAEGALLIQGQVKKHIEQVAALQMQKTNSILGSAQQLFGGLAGLAKTFGGEQSKAYKVMFAVQKGFAIAQGIMNLTTSISQASILPFPTNIPAMATAATTGASLLASLRGSAYSGQAHDGLARVPSGNEGTYMLRKDEMVLNPRQRDNFDRMRESFDKNGSSAGSKVIQYNFTPTIQIDAPNGADEAKVRQAVEMALQEYDQELQQDLASNGPRAQLLGGRAA
jgi:tape measure domain-containing protein